MPLSANGLLPVLSQYWLQNLYSGDTRHFFLEIMFVNN